MKVITRNYSTFYDQAERQQFDPVLDRISGCYVGEAEVDDAAAARYADRPGFEVLTDEQWLAMTLPKRAPAKAAPVTGDPLGDAAAEKAGAGGEGQESPASTGGEGDPPSSTGEPAVVAQNPASEPPAPPRSK